MEQIDVSDLPEPLARAIEAMVESVRHQLHPHIKHARELPLWEGEVIGSLTREEIYEDAV